jgi:hypothetical protein
LWYVSLCSINVLITDTAFIEAVVVNMNKSCCPFRLGCWFVAYKLKKKVEPSSFAYQATTGSNEYWSMSTCALQYKCTNAFFCTIQSEHIVWHTWCMYLYHVIHVPVLVLELHNTCGCNMQPMARKAMSDERWVTPTELSPAPAPAPASTWKWSSEIVQPNISEVTCDVAFIRWMLRFVVHTVPYRTVRIWCSTFSIALCISTKIPIPN